MEKIMSKVKYHPIYENMRDEWRKMIEAYEGSGGFADGGYLHRHEKESDTKFHNRRKLAKYFNFAEVIIDTIRDSCLREKAERSVSDKRLENIFADVDLCGKTWDTYLKEQLTLALIFGFVDTLVDVPTGDRDSILSSHDEQHAGLRPYMVTVHPLNLVNWKHDRRGLASILIKENENENSFFEDEHEGEKKNTRYRYFDRQKWALYNEDAEIIDEGVHALGVVPLARLYCKKSVQHPFIGKSILPDPDILIDYYNLDSEKREIFRQQTFSLLLISMGETGTREDIRNLVLTGTNNAIALPYGASAKFISPDPDQARLLIEEQKEIVRNIFRLKHLKYDTGGSAEKSGEAFRWDYKDMSELLAGLAANLEDFENRIVTIISKWGNDPRIRESFAVKYPRDFNIYSLRETLENAASLVSLGLGERVKTAFAQKALLPKLMPLTEEEKRTILSD